LERVTEMLSHDKTKNTIETSNKNNL